MKKFDAIMTVGATIAAIVYTGRGCLMWLGVCESVPLAPHLQQLTAAVALLFLATRFKKGWK